ncbi:MAG: hypothetical protein ABI947_17050 [Chloroflexota bacterium]
MPKHIVYQPPSRKLVSEYVKQVCERLAQERGSSYLAPEVMSGFTEFLLIVGIILANRLNEHCEMEDKVAKK